VWHIACPGPSLDFERIPDDGNPLICVNAALKAAPRCDFWVCWDSPNKIHEQAFPRARELQPILVCGTYGARDNWVTVMRESCLWPWATWLDMVVNPKPWGPPWYMEATKGPAFSTFSAMGWALKRGATDLRLYGADMSGMGYYDDRVTRLKAAQKPNARWGKRWKAESQMYEGARREGLRRKVRIVRSLPDGRWDELSDR